MESCAPRGVYSAVCTSSNHSSSEIATLLDRDEGHDDPAQLERTLTDGYAQALTLEAERTAGAARSRLSLELDENGEATLLEVQALARQLHECDDSVERLRGELVRLKPRGTRAPCTAGPAGPPRAGS